METIEITDFSGRLTRRLNGDLNSGFAKFTTSFGYDPFSKPGNLTWFEAATDITASVVGMTGLPLAAKARAELLAPATQYVYLITSTGQLAKIQPNKSGSPNIPNYDIGSVLGTLTDGSPTFNFGASMDFYNSPSSVAGEFKKIYVGSDTRVSSIGFDGSNDTSIGAGGYLGNSFRPLKQFIGKLFFGNGNTIGAIDSTGTVTSSIIGTGQGNLYSEWNPPLPVEMKVHDIDSSIDGNYLLVTSSGISNEKLTEVGDDVQASASSEGRLDLYNGTDTTTTAFSSVPSYAVSALQTYLDKNIFFSNDSFGSSLSNGSEKILTLPNNKSPLPNATLVNGNFISWVCPELAPDLSTQVASMYYFGSLDQENPPGLYRVLRYSATLLNGIVYQTPLNILTNNKYISLSSDLLSISTFGYGKHYFSVMNVSSVATQNRLIRFLITPTGTGSPPSGVAYETQTQLFSKKITVKQIRVYCEPTVASNSFSLSLIGGDGSILTNGTGTYTYAAGTNITLLQGALERIDFNLTPSTYAMGVRITNLGSTNMTIKKVELDWTEQGK